jgi:hypothetical protein
MSVVYPPANPRARCRKRLPDPEAYPEYTLAQCSDCSRWYYRWTDYTYWVERVWRPVHWWNPILRHRIRASLKEK